MPEKTPSAAPEQRGCDNCKHERLSVQQEPCTSCDADYNDNWEPVTLAATPAVPYAWAVSGLGRPFYGQYAEQDARDEARRCGGTSEAFPLYRGQAPVAAGGLRERFEAWFADSRRSRGADRRPGYTKLADGTYADDHVQRHWWTYQQGAQALAAAGGTAPQQCPECIEQARLLGMGAEREAALQAQVEQLTRAGGTAPEMADVPRRQADSTPLDRMIRIGTLRPVVVEALREVTGAPDMEGNGLSLVEEIERVAIAASDMLADPAPGMARWVDVHYLQPDAQTDVLVRGIRHGVEVMYDVAGIFHGEWMSQATECEVPWEVTHWMRIPLLSDDSSVQVTQTGGGNG